MLGLGIARRLRRLAEPLEPPPLPPPAPPLPATRVSSLAEHRRRLAATEAERAARAAEEASLVRPGGSFEVPGTCAVCRRAVAFRVEMEHALREADGTARPNWREHLACPGCGLNERARAALLRLEERLREGGTLYLTEQVTPLFRAAAARLGRVVGSEYLRDGTPPGATDARGLRHEDVTALTFPDASFQALGCFEVLEHVPDHRPALRELHRVLAPGGVLVLTVPFALHREEAVERARLRPDGSVEHLLEPEYHGDPLSEAGALCYRHFGWSLLRELEAAGFREPALEFHWSRALGHLGADPFVVTARRPW